jgi:hypothetical protein
MQHFPETWSLKRKGREAWLTRPTLTSLLRPHSDDARPLESKSRFGHQLSTPGKIRRIVVLALIAHTVALQLLMRHDHYCGTVVAVGKDTVCQGRDGPQPLEYRAQMRLQGTVVMTAPIGVVR